MPQEQWAAVDRYFTEQLHLSDSVLEAALQANSAAKLPVIDVTPTQGCFIHLLARMISAKRILEIGTLGGYSTIWLARALPPEGRLISLEFSSAHAEIAQSNIQRAGLSDRVEIRVGAALDSLPNIAQQGLAPFDFIFIDADKPNNLHYLEWALKLSRPGTLIVVDNVVRDGAIADASSSDSSIIGTRQMFETMSGNPRLSATALQTVGAKGYDGFAIAIVGPPS